MSLTSVAEAAPHESPSARIESVTTGIWLVEDRLRLPGGASLPIRMTALRLDDGSLLLHSPTPYSRSLQQALERIGPIRYLLAPNIAHWVSVPDWQKALPGALTFAAPGLARRRAARDAGLQVHREIFEDTPDEWQKSLKTVLVAAPGFSEVALFHMASRTLILTDLVVNVRTDALSRPAGAFARMVGAAAPDGRAPAYLRGLLRLGGRGMRMTALRLLALAPERVIFAHGEWYRTDARLRLTRALRSLTGNAATARAREELAGRCVVITGASSGIGRASALLLAARGACLVLASRRGEVLEELARDCEALGGEALAVSTDVTDPEAVNTLASRAVERFGGIDVWINNAGTGVVGRFHEAALRLHRKTLEVNLFGALHGAHAVLPIFERQRRGILINNISMGGWVPTPFAASYTASKFALRGFTASLRQELTDLPGVRVCAVFPAMVDTPGFAHGANQSGRHLDPGPLLYQAEDVAQTFLSLIRHPRPEVAVGWPARAAQIAYAAAPALTEQVVGATFRQLFSQAALAENTEGALLTPLAAGRGMSGGWLARKRLPSAGQISRLALLLGAGALGIVALSRIPRRQRNG